MAGIFAVLGSTDPERILAAARHLTFFPEEEVETSGETGFSFAWVGHGERSDFGPALDPATGVRVVSSGRVAWDEGDWKRAERMTSLVGGLSNRLVLAEYLAGGVAAVERHNGSAALLIWDPRTAEIHLLTDHFGYHPVFVYRPDDPAQCVVCTFPDAIAEDSNTSTTPDHVSMAEFLRAWRITPPHTYYTEVKHAGAAAHWKWDLHSGTTSHRTYWDPGRAPAWETIDEAAEELAHAVSNAVRIRTLSRLGPVLCFVSGGADSRVMLFGAADPGSMIGLNVFDVPNQEAAISRELCVRAGVRYVGFARDSDYYPRWMAEGARLSGGMWSLEDNHFLGTRDIVAASGARTVMTACTTDWLFKGYGLEKRYLTLAGRNLPVKTFVDRRVDGFLPNVPTPPPPALASDVHQRMATWFAGTPEVMTTDRDRLAVEDRRVRPACYAVSVSGQIMFRIFPYDTFLADRAVADCYSRTPARWKLNGDLWGRAAARICAGNGGTVDANFGWRVGASTAEKLAVFARRWVSRRLRPEASVVGQGPATDGSWPDLGWYLHHSPTIRDFWDGVSPDERKLISHLWGSDPWKIPLEGWARDPNGLFRILTLLNHWSARRSIPRAVASEAKRQGGSPALRP